MVFKGLRLQIIIPAALAALVVFFLGQMLYEQYFVLNPLGAYLEKIEGVEAVEIVDGDREKEFIVFLGEVDDLLLTHQELSDVFRQRGAYSFSLRDRRDKELEEVFHQIHFVLYEAITSGNFSHMADVVAREAVENGLSHYRVTVDGERIYLQLHRNGSFLYEVIPRVSPGGEEDYRQ